MCEFVYLVKESEVIQGVNDFLIKKNPTNLIATGPLADSWNIFC